MNTSENKTSNGKGAEKSAPAPTTLETTTSSSKEMKSQAEIEKQIEERLRKKLEAEYAAKAKETEAKKLSPQEELAQAVNAKSIELGTPDANRVIIVRAKNVASDGEVRLGQLLPGIKKGYHVYKNEFGLYETGMTNQELISLNERLPVWDKEKGIPDPEFWQKYSLTLTTSEKRLHIDKSPRHYIDWKVALSHPDIANRESDLTSRTPFYIVDEEAEAKQSNMELDALTKAYNYITKMSPTEKRSFLSLLGVPSKDSTDSVVILHLRQQAEQAPSKFVAYYEDGAKGEKVIISEMVDYNILRKVNGAYYYNESLLAVDMLAAVQWMSDLKNQDVKLKLMQELEVSKRKG